MDPEIPTPTSPNPQASSAAATPPPAAPGDAAGAQSADWEKRYQGMRQVLTARDAKIQELEAQGQSSATLIDQLQSQLNAAKAEYDAKALGLSQQLTTLTGERDTALQTNGSLNAYKVKMEALKDFPALLPLADSIPDIPDPAVMKQHLELMAKGVDQIANQRAQQLTAGMVPGPTAPAQTSQYAFTKIDDWQVALNNAAGTDEFVKIATAFKVWAGKQQP
jgi:hypothetical protein